MFRKLALALVAATALGTAAMAPTSASAWGFGGSHSGFHGHHGYGYGGGYGWGYRHFGWGYGRGWCYWQSVLLLPVLIALAGRGFRPAAPVSQGCRPRANTLVSWNMTRDLVAATSVLRGSQCRNWRRGRSA